MKLQSFYVVTEVMVNLNYKVSFFMHSNAVSDWAGGQDGINVHESQI